MKQINLNEMELIIAGQDSVNCLGRGMATPFMIVFSGFMSSNYLNSWWVDTVENCS